jgi:dTDP-glucose 4,6-dehydratase
MNVLITGGAGFIGSAVVRHLLGNRLANVAVIDAMTYAASPQTLAPFAGRSDFALYEEDICNTEAVRKIFREVQPDIVMHLAAESHVDRSIEAPAKFVQTNVLGTQVLLDAALSYWRTLGSDTAARFRFHHISTDEVFGSLGETDSFREDTRYDPRSPYSASKAASDHLVRAFFHTYALPIVISNCSNNYGPYQFPEKLIPLMILRGLQGEPMPVYGDGLNVRDWLYVDDHAEALWTVVTKGRVGDTYLIGGQSERQNRQVVQTIVSLLDEMVPAEQSRQRLITFVQDRPGHDRRYAIDCGKLRRETGWAPRNTFEDGLRKTVEWYVANKAWWAPILAKTYRLERLGAAVA